MVNISAFQKTQDLADWFNKTNTAKDAVIDATEAAAVGLTSTEYEIIEKKVADAETGITLNDWLAYAEAEAKTIKFEIKRVYLNDSYTAALVNDFQYRIALSSSLLTADIAKLVTTNEIKQSERAALKLKFDLPIQDRITFSEHNLWNELVSSNNGLTITAADLASLFDNPKKSYLVEAVRYKSKWKVIDCANGMFYSTKLDFDWLGGVANLTYNVALGLDDIGNGWQIAVTPNKMFLIGNTSESRYALYDAKTFAPLPGNYAKLTEKFYPTYANNIYSTPDGLVCISAQDDTGYALFNTMTHQPLTAYEKYPLVGFPSKYYLNKGNTLVDEKTGLTIEGTFETFISNPAQIIVAKDKKYAFYDFLTAKKISSDFDNISLKKYPFKGEDCYLVASTQGYAFYSTKTAKIVSPWFKIIEDKDQCLEPLSHTFKGKLCYKVETETSKGFSYLSAATGEILE
jgi:hypothetical protein